MEHLEEILVTRTYLEMVRKEQFKPCTSSDEHIQIAEVINCKASFYRYLYVSVGRGYNWVDRLAWTDEQISSYLASSDLSLWVMNYNSSTAGYFELLKYEDSSTEIAYFGLFPEFIGRGLGKHLLSVAVELAWKGGARRVWLQTCTLDDQAALPNYIKRGFVPYKTETYRTEVKTLRLLKSKSATSGFLP